jgi:hypothetical protein
MAAPIRGVWNIRGMDATKPKGLDFDGLRAFTGSIDAQSSGPITSIYKVGPWSYAPQGGVARQHVKAWAGSYGELHAWAQVECDQPWTEYFANYSTQNAPRASVKSEFADTLQIPSFLPTPSRPVPEPLTLKLRLDGTLSFTANPGALGQPQFMERAGVNIRAAGPRAYGIDPVTNNPLPNGWPITASAEVVSGTFSGTLFALGSRDVTKSITLYVLPDDYTAAPGGAPYPVSYRFSMSIEAFAEASNQIATSDASHTLSIESILLPDGTTPESQGMSLAFESGIASPNLRGVPEPGGMALALAIFLGGVARRRR